MKNALDRYKRLEDLLTDICNGKNRYHLSLCNIRELVHFLERTQETTISMQTKDVLVACGFEVYEQGIGWRIASDDDDEFVKEALIKAFWYRYGWNKNILIGDECYRYDSIDNLVYRVTDETPDGHANYKAVATYERDGKRGLITRQNFRWISEL